MGLSIKNFDLRVPGKTLLKDADFRVASGKKYGLVGKNGAGKSTLLAEISNGRMFPDMSENDRKNILLVEQEIPDLDKSVYDFVWSSNRELCTLLAEAEQLEKTLQDEDEDDIDCDLLNVVYEKLRSLEFQKQPAILKRILHGLGFSEEAQSKPISSFSGGWRMRVALAKGLFLQPKLLLLDEPSNHLDLNAAVWLTNYIESVKSTVVIVSHDQALLDQVCDWIIYFDSDAKILLYFRGNYKQYEKMITQKRAIDEKEWIKLQKRLKQLKTKKQRQELLKKTNLREPVKAYRPRINFGEPTVLRSEHPLRLENVSVGYNSEDVSILSNVSISVNSETRITLVGANGAGKSTFLKLLAGELDDYVGGLCAEINRDSRLSIGFYHQHSSESLDKDKTPVECIIDANKNWGKFDARKALGTIGLHGKLHNAAIRTLSGGQKARVAFCVLFAQSPHVMLLDEPTNHLDIETVNGLINAINEYPGGVVMVTHDEKLVTETECRLWVCEDGTIKRYGYEYEDYKDEILEDE